MSPANRKKSTLNTRTLLLNAAIVILGGVVFFLFYSFISTTFVHKPVEWKTKNPGRTGGGETIQLDVLNGCGTPGIAQKFTDYLRKRHFDVVNSKNYISFDVENSLVIDRIGDKETAQKVAHALGIGDEHIVQQINPDYYLHVSVVIGRDYQNLKPME